MTKVQIILEDEAVLNTVRQTLMLLKLTKKGKIYEMTIRGERDEIMAFLESLHPTYLELLPLSLEEVFMSEMEVTGYEKH